MGKLVRQSVERFEKREEERKGGEKSERERKTEVDWADIDADEPINDMTYVNLGGSVQIKYPQEEQRRRATAARKGESGWVSE